MFLPYKNGDEDDKKCIFKNNNEQNNVLHLRMKYRIPL